ncbi:MAG: hypothetical protein MZW92_12830 [Comamonadaceae bacterium]|nr:hypothetical protein [Comamonadaceae bacterium]
MATGPVLAARKRDREEGDCKENRCEEGNLEESHREESGREETCREEGRSREEGRFGVAMAPSKPCKSVTAGAPKPGADVVR